jgi:hypothetical protein
LLWQELFFFYLETHNRQRHTAQAKGERHEEDLKS